MNELTQTAFATLRQYQMIAQGDTVVVALSGGADSVALFHFLVMQQETLGITVKAAHLNHGIRETATRDADFVAALCQKYHIPLQTKTLQAPKQASELWARTQRYAFFAQLGQQVKIATAHTQNDNAETVLLHLARGTGSRGATGIAPVRENIIRPFLNVSRQSILAYLAQNNLSYVEDETNATDAYARNRVRHHVLPNMETVHPGATQAIARFALQMAQLQQYLDEQAGQLLKTTQIAPDTWDAEKLAHAPMPVCKTALAEIIKKMAKQEKTALTDAVYQTLFSGGGVALAKDTTLCVKQGQLRLQKKAVQSQWEIPFAVGTFCLEDGREVTVTIQSCEEIINSVKHGLNFFADYDRILNSSCFRTRRSGDTFTQAGRGVTKTLHKLFSQDKMAPAQRESCLVLAQNSTILFVENYGFAQSVVPIKNTKRVCSITVQRVSEEC